MSKRIGRPVTDERHLEILADKILKADRHESCDCVSCKQFFYLDKQYKNRTAKEVPLD